MTSTDRNIQDEVDANFAAFQRQLPELLTEHHGKFALLRDGEIVGYWDTARDALLVGNDRFSDRRFSVQEVVDSTVNLGFFSHAMYDCPA